MTVHISSRLLAVAREVPQGARVIDVGTDHGLVPVWLAQTGRAAHVFASDIRPGPLRSAASLVRQTGTDGVIDLRLTDGLRGYSPEDADTVIIAGMGGETMAQILSDAPWLREHGANIILSPHTKQAELRRFLISNGYAVRKELLTEDAGRVYPILVAAAGQAPPYAEAELHTGLYSQISAQPLFASFLDTLIKRAMAAAPYDPGARVLLSEFEAMKARLLR